MFAIGKLFIFNLSTSKDSLNDNASRGISALPSTMQFRRKDIQTLCNPCIYALPFLSWQALYSQISPLTE